MGAKKLNNLILGSVWETGQEEEVEGQEEKEKEEEGEGGGHW